MKTVNLMLKPASSLCDLRCKYCFYADVSARREQACRGLMTPETVQALLQRLRAELSPGDCVQFVFQGGEPTLAGLPFFRDFVDRVEQWREIRVTWALQTNGMGLDEAWCGFLRAHGFLVGLSLDLLPEAHDAVRVDSVGRGTCAAVTERLELLRRRGVAVNVLCTLTPAVAAQPLQVWERLTELEVDFVQFTPCLGPLDGEASPYALTPQLFASFYTKLFALWYADYRRGVRRSVKLFDDVVNQLLLGRPTGCGMNGRCAPQLVVEADGSVYPCDFYCLDAYRMGSLTEQTLSQLLASEGLARFLTRPHRQPALCGGCPYRDFCGGNCRRMQREICCADGEFCGYREFLNQCGGTLFRLAEQLRRTLWNRTGG